MSATLEDIEMAVYEGQLMRSDLSLKMQDDISKDNPCDDCDFLEIDKTVEALAYRASLHDIGDVSQSLYLCLIGNGIPQSPRSDAYYTASDDNSIPNESTILSSWTKIRFPRGGSPVIPWAVPATDLKYLKVAVTRSEPVRNWYQDVFNNFNAAKIGTDQDFFGAAVEVGGFNVQVTNYLTYYDAPSEPRGIRFDSR